MIRYSFLVAVSLALLSGCSSENEHQVETLVLTGSSTVAPLANEIGKRFERLNPTVRVDVQTGGSSRGVADARRDLADIGMVSRDLTAEESDLVAITIARDGICVIVHRENPVASLDREQIIAIYTGKIVNWKEVGGNDLPITVVNKAEGRSTLELFADYFGLKNRDIQADVVIGDNEQGVKTVAGDIAAIGYVSIGTAQYDASVGVPIRLLPMDSIEASIDNVKNGTYPLARPLNLVVKVSDELALSKGMKKRFIDFALSTENHETILEQYFVPASP